MTESAALNITASVDKETITEISTALSSLLKVASETRTNDEVTLAALRVFSKAATVENISISNCHISTDSSKKVVVQVPEEFSKEDSTYGVSMKGSQ